MKRTDPEVSPYLLEPEFSEKWTWKMGYAFRGTFILEGAGLTTERMADDAHFLFQATRQSRVIPIPRGLAVYLLVPIYCSSTFPEAIVRTLRLGSRHPFHRQLKRWGVLVKPVLYNSQSNEIEFEEALQNDNALAYSLLAALYREGTRRAARSFGHTTPPVKAIYKQLPLFQ